MIFLEFHLKDIFIEFFFRKINFFCINILYYKTVFSELKMISEENIVYIGNKPLMNYVLAVGLK